MLQSASIKHLRTLLFTYAMNMGENMEPIPKMTANTYAAVDFKLIDPPHNARLTKEAFGSIVEEAINASFKGQEADAATAVKARCMQEYDIAMEMQAKAGKKPTL